MKSAQIPQIRSDSWERAQTSQNQLRCLKTIPATPSQSRPLKASPAAPQNSSDLLKPVQIPPKPAQTLQPQHNPLETISAPQSPCGHGGAAGGAGAGARAHPPPSQDERNQVLTSYLWVRQAWLDAHLTWDKDAYGGIDSIRIPSSYVWRPDIVLYNKWVALAPTRRGCKGASQIRGWGKGSRWG